MVMMSVVVLHARLFSYVGQEKNNLHTFINTRNAIRVLF